MKFVSIDSYIQMIKYFSQCIAFKEVLCTFIAKADQILGEKERLKERNSIYSYTFINVCVCRCVDAVILTYFSV